MAVAAVLARNLTVLRLLSRVSRGDDPSDCDLVDESLLRNRYFLSVFKEFFNT